MVEKPGFSLLKNFFSSTYKSELASGMTGDYDYGRWHTCNSGNVKRQLAEMLCEYVPRDACVIAYAASFIKERIKELAIEFSDLSAYLLEIRGRIVDLSEPFRMGIYYHQNMGGSNSLGAVFTSLARDDYRYNQDVFEADQLDKALLQNSALSTKAMMFVYEKLRAIARNGRNLQFLSDLEQDRKNELQEVVKKYKSYPRSSNMLAVFWYLDGEFFGLACPKNEHEVINRGNSLDLPYGHYELWEYCKPVSCKFEYDEIPYGRITYYTEIQEFIIAVSTESLICDDFEKRVINEFGLPESTILFVMGGGFLVEEDW